MACIQPDGTLSGAAQTILGLLEEPAPAQTIAQRLQKPLYAVRASLRELSVAGLVEETDGLYELTPTGQQRAGDFHKRG